MHTKEFSNPVRDKNQSAAVLYAAKKCGVKEIYRIGGAQAIAALAYGTKTIQRVDKIVGPGNIYVAAAKKIELQFGTIGNESLITRARNTIVQLFMDGDYTHLLFIDADLAFNPTAVIRMLEYDKDVVTGIYPRKTIDWIKVKKRLKENPDIAKYVLKNFFKNG